VRHGRCLWWWVDAVLVMLLIESGFMMMRWMWRGGTVVYWWAVAEAEWEDLGAVLQVAVGPDLVWGVVVEDVEEGPAGARGGGPRGGACFITMWLFLVGGRRKQRVERFGYGGGHFSLGWRGLFDWCWKRGDSKFVVLSLRLRTR